MKKNIKSILSFLFAIVLIFYYCMIDDNNIKTVSVFGETVLNMNDYNNYLVDFEDNLSTKNFNEKFSVLEKNKYEIKQLYLNVNELWEEHIKQKLSKYSYDNLDKFINYYKKVLSENNLIDEIPNVDTYGIKINKILIYTSKENINILKEKYRINYLIN